MIMGTVGSVDIFTHLTNTDENYCKVSSRAHFRGTLLICSRPFLYDAQCSMTVKMRFPDNPLASSAILVERGTDYGNK